MHKRQPESYWSTNNVLSTQFQKNKKLRWMFWYFFLSSMWQQCLYKKLQAEYDTR